MISLILLKIGILKKDLSKEFEAVGFFISDHPLNQFKEIFEDYKIIDFNDFLNLVMRLKKQI